MDKSCKIAIVTLYDNINIGNKLQNYALQEILRHYSNNVSTLTYTEARTLAPIIGWKGIIVSIIGYPKELAKQKKAIINRLKAFQLFSSQYIKVEKAIPFAQFGKETNDNFDLFVVGSDQVWHNFFDSDEDLDFFMLRFAEKEKRACFAPSFGFDNIPMKYKDRYITGLRGFNYLSCREENGCKMIEELTGKKAVLLPDPTLYFSKERWETIEKKPSFNIPTHFILSYFLGGKDQTIKEEVTILQKESNLPVIDIYDLRYPEYYVTRPDEFLYLLRRADFFCTDSYHGCLFSVIYEKATKVIQRRDDVGRGMNARFSTLFNQLKIRLNDRGFIQCSDVCRIL